jgi:fructokinase
MTTIPWRIGIDLGGTKIAGVVLNAEGVAVSQRRVPAPQGDYAATLKAIVDLVDWLKASVDAVCFVGIGMPGSFSPITGRVQNANSTWLNGRDFKADIQSLIPRVNFANDADCFALSEATDGAGAGHTTVFGVILGTGCGGGLVIDGGLVNGPRGIGGEWGHNPLPWPTPDELNVPPCWCGRQGCMETWVSGSGLAADHARVTGEQLRGEAIVAAAAGGQLAAQATLDRHAHRLARGLATVVNLFDPDVIVLGGGLSALPHLYDVLPGLMAPYVFSEHPDVKVMPPRWGDASGVRGAARLWP